MKTATYIKLDSAVKQQAQNLAEDVGLSLSGLINAQLKEFVRSKKLVLNSKPEQMSPELEELLGPIDRDIKTGRNLSKVMETPEDVRRVFADL